MNVQFSGVDPASVDRRQGQTSGPAPAEQQQRARPAEAENRPQAADKREASTRVTVSAEAKARLAEEETGAREEIRKAVEDKGAIARLLETQKERVSASSQEQALPPPPTRPSPDDKGSIRAAEQRLASAGIAT